MKEDKFSIVLSIGQLKSMIKLIESREYPEGKAEDTDCGIFEIDKFWEWFTGYARNVGEKELKRIYP